MKPDSKRIAAAFRAAQDAISNFLDVEDQPHRQDLWEYARESGGRSGGSGGGRTRIWEEGPLLEKGGVGFSEIHGTSLPASAATQFQIPPGTPFTATGVSLVMHPRNPHVPTIHMNIRYFAAGDIWWFGGGVDLTPYYPVEARVIGFHRALRDLCAAHGQDHSVHKKACDEYFFLKHRGEARGVGGIFFDHLRRDAEGDFAFTLGLGNLFPDLYRPFLEARQHSVTEKQREFQLYRRSRYVEFNLLQDRGTLFGLQSGGRTESILMSMPPLARWIYGFQPDPGSDEDRLTAYYLQPRDWAGLP